MAKICIKRSKLRALLHKAWRQGYARGRQDQVLCEKEGAPWRTLKTVG